MNVVDSSGWIEYFIDSPTSTFFTPAIETTAQLLVPVVSLYEVHKFLSRHATLAQVELSLDIMRRGRIIELNDPRAIAASNIARQHKLAMADAAMYAVAAEFNATFWTQDVDYRGLPGVRFQAKLPQR